MNLLIKFIYAIALSTVGSIVSSAERLTQWNCPHCGEFFDINQQEEIEEATVGGIILPGELNIPHIRCPKCKKCMKCRK